ncbi:hypothetical protein ACFE04_003008 [Oxalis oulophora]
MDSSVAPISSTTHGHDQETTTTKKLLPKPSKGGWSAAIFIIFVEVAERFAYYGLAGNLITYLTNNFHEPLATAAKNVNMWVGVSALFPIIGAFVADSYLGRFKTIIVSCIVYFMGMVLLTLSVSVIHESYRVAVFYTALYILAVGEGGHKPCVQTFAADQFDEGNEAEKAEKSSFFNWWYLGIVFGASAAVIFVIYVQDNFGWALALAFLAGTLGGALLLFLIGIKRYRKQVPVGSPFTSISQVFVAAWHKRHVSETRDVLSLCYKVDDDETIDGGRKSKGPTLARTNQFRCLDKAMIIDDIDTASRTRDPWRLCTVNQVEEVKLVLGLIPIGLACLMYAAVLVQLHTFYTKQGSTMYRSIGPHFKIPPASLQSVVGLTILIAVPIYDRVFVPMARKITGHPAGITMLQRIGVGLFISVIQMVVSALVESRRVSVAREYGLIDMPKATVPMSLWWIVPQYMLSGIGDVFIIVGLQELFYDQVPEEMRSVGAAAYLCVTGVGSFVSTWIISAVQAITSKNGHPWLGDNINRAHLDRYYWVVAVLSGLNVCVYIWIAKRYVYKKVEAVEEKIDENV